MAKDKHPWLWDRSLSGGADVEPGDVVTVTFRKQMIAYGMYDPNSPLRVRLLSWDLSQQPGEEWAHEVATAAAERRVADRKLSKCSGQRLLHGEGDWTPGLVLDAYNGFGVARFDGPACEAFWRPRLSAVVHGLAEGGAHLRGVVRTGRESEVLWGEAPPKEPMVFEENGIRYEVDVWRGMKTGFFLDQRENRRQLRAVSQDRDVLDLFSYTGGFAISAALGGASSTVAVDQSAAAVNACRRNYELNGLEAQVVEGGPSSLASAGWAPHSLFAMDCGRFLDEVATQGKLFDVVVCDPPSMAPSARTRGRAMQKYVDLNVGSLQVLREGGLLISCSCSSHINAKDLRQAVEQAGRLSGRQLKIESEARAATDHPLRRGFPEGNYLQALYVRVLENSPKRRTAGQEADPPSMVLVSEEC